MTLPTSHDQIAPAVQAIRKAVYETARNERWSGDEIAPEVAQRLAALADDLQAAGRSDLAEFVRRHFAQ